ncbi:hypothetical protein BMS3Abin02_00456 [bacterium BMS3Abin02]|nr:hypothetical protein BMS3Abin02_00456 [bacterium BMS3Abin02]GBE21854.1 hypothetical protein BMS3Bbin01_01206 [bacterium BMS3Bbin01]HDH26128.1 carboxypeptidase regulatory-like domain-containing protein [Actinomycetota bacterium]HDL50346.1 carboxypeptidase regulatory-like domain-containing protein [Actinomycetota bacterium]
MLELPLAAACSWAPRDGKGGRRASDFLPGRRGTSPALSNVERTVKIIILLLLVLSAGCSTTPPVSTFTVEGYVHAGPTCPTMQEPPDPDCADRPVPNAEVIVWGPADNEVARAKTDAQGRFRLELPAGSYILVPQPVKGLLGTAPMQDFIVPGAGLLDVAYDTGIR